MRYPLDELIDKRSIVQLKIERIGDEEDRLELQREFQDYSTAIQEYIEEGVCTLEQVSEWHNRLYKANGIIWDLESAIRRGQIKDISLEEVGRAAIKIRESNGARVGIKSEIVSEVGIGYRDIKINHASQKTIDERSI